MICFGEILDVKMFTYHRVEKHRKLLCVSTGDKLSMRSEFCSVVTRRESCWRTLFSKEQMDWSLDHVTVVLFKNLTSRFIGRMS